MDSRTKDILRYAAGLPLAGVLLYFSFRKVDFGEFTAAISGCRWGFVLLAMLAGALSALVRAARWKMLLRPVYPGATTLSCFNAVNIGNAVNLVLPRAGELARCLYAGPADKALGTVVAERAWDVLTLLIVAALVPLIGGAKVSAFFTENIFSPLSGAASVKGILVLLAGAALIAIAIYAFRGRLRKILSGLAEGLKSCLKMDRAWLFLAYTVIMWGLYVVMSQCIILAVRPMCAEVASLGLADAAVLMCVGSVSSVVPVPGGFGAFHYLVSLALTSVYGLSAGPALAFATLSHESQVLVQILCGGLSYMYETFRKRG